MDAVFITFESDRNPVQNDLSRKEYIYLSEQSKGNCSRYAGIQELRWSHQESDSPSHVSILALFSTRSFLWIMPSSSRLKSLVELKMLMQEDIFLPNHVLKSSTMASWLGAWASGWTVVKMWEIRSWLRPGSCAHLCSHSEPHEPRARRGGYSHENRRRGNGFWVGNQDMFMNGLFGSNNYMNPTVENQSFAPSF